ncbi:DedA family protein [Ilumatobacter sp.]|uniref:DedA family protein n=1 Tax=Ilumatobacter sp. TaxID=1967498 RepID=UPI003C486E72
MIANIITDVTDRLQDFSAYWWFPLVVFAVALLDSVFPIVPGETMVIVGGVAAGQGNQSIVLIILVAAIGAFIGDNLAYFIGRHFSERVDDWADRKPSRSSRLDAADRQIKIRGGLLLITARFIPGGRTILTISCGLTNQPWPWFAKWIIIATTIWGSYAALLGYFFGQAFEDDHALAFWLAFGAALAITGLIELVRWLRHRGSGVKPIA